MFRKNFALAIFILSVNYFFSQVPWYRYNWDSISTKNFPDMLNSIYKFDLNYYKDNIYIGQYYKNFAAMQAKSVDNDVKYGHFYSLSEYDNYLRKVLEKTVQDTSISNKIKIFVSRSSEANAFMDGSGVLRLNIGDIARYDTESEIAATFGHEVSHFTNHDVIKDFGKRIESYFNPSFTFSFGFYIPFTGHFINFVDPYSEYYWFNRAEESGADFQSIKYIKNSAYSMRGMTDMFRKMKRNEIRSQIRFGERNSALRTHPDPGDRLKQVGFLSNDSLNKGKKNFVVDSMTFAKLKSMAQMEMINIGMERNQLLEVVESTFKTYLFEPDNQNNLAILIEALRRIILFNKDDKSAELPFILSRYQTEHVKESKTYGFLNEKNPSILKHLTSGFIDVTKKDLPLIKAKELLDTSNVAFTSYIEAYNYFKKKAAETNCSVCDHYTFFDKDPDVLKVKNFLGQKSPFDTRSYLENLVSAKERSKEMIVVMPPSLSSGFHIFDTISFDNKSKFYDTIVNIVKSKTSSATVVKYEDLPFTDKHHLICLMNNCTFFLKIKENIPYKYDKTDWTKYSPELFSFFDRNDLKSVYIIYSSLDIGKDKKSYQNCSLYKVSIPNAKTSSFAASVKNNIINTEEKYGSFYKKVATEFDYFYRLAK